MDRRSEPARVVVAASGRGRSFENLIKSEPSFKSYKVLGLVSSTSACGAVKIANDLNLPVFVDHFDGGLDPKAKLQNWLLNLKPEWIVLAGFLKVFPIRFTGKLQTTKIVNIHPSLLPKFGGKGMYGKYVHQAVLSSGDSESGATIHFVDSEYDQGQIVAQTRVPVLADDDPGKLASRVFAAECRLYPKVLDELICGHLPLAGRKIKTYQDQTVLLS